MTPKEKAEELVETYYSTIMSFLNDNMRWENAKKCALIAVDEIYSNNTDESKNDYWIEVEQEIQKL